ncbi:MAG: helix-turn-helix domain-containing protein [Bacteroidales bacterium]
MNKIKDIINLINIQNSLIRKNANNYSLLTKREKELIHYLSNGYSENQIINIMKIKSSTYSNYKRKAFIKLDIQNTVELSGYIPINNPRKKSDI